ncbi:unnamed protein product [Closterium sp. Naga37s-1]|nr:unnamed protein product [Closterium sp. Naga37s-1]CAI5533530.1 unnamed protein product [Closterium sp. Naga37s-1]
MVIATKGNEGAAANDLPAANASVHVEDEADADSKVGHATKDVRMVDLTYKELKTLPKDQLALPKGHDLTCSLCGVTPVPHKATSTASDAAGAAAAAAMRLQPSASATAVADVCNRVLLVQAQAASRCCPPTAAAPVRLLV